MWRLLINSWFTAVCLLVNQHRKQPQTERCVVLGIFPCFLALNCWIFASLFPFFFHQKLLNAWLWIVFVACPVIVIADRCAEWRHAFSAKRPFPSPCSSTSWPTKMGWNYRWSVSERGLSGWRCRVWRGNWWRLCAVSRHLKVLFSLRAHQKYSIHMKSIVYFTVFEKRMKNKIAVEFFHKRIFPQVIRMMNFTSERLLAGLLDGSFRVTSKSRRKMFTLYQTRSMFIITAAKMDLTR